MKLSDLRSKPLFETVFSMFRFGLSSMLGTLVDFLVFTFVFVPIMPLFYAEICAALCGMIINFFMHKRFVFQLQRRAYAAFALSITASFAVMTLGAWFITVLATIPFLEANIVVAKLIVMGSKFALNYFSKRWVFEKKIFRR